MNITLTDEDVLVAVTEYLSSRGLQMAGDAQLQIQMEGERVVVVVTGVTLTPLPARRVKEPTAMHQPRTGKPVDSGASNDQEFSDAEQAALQAQSLVLESGTAPSLDDRLRNDFNRASGGKPPTEWQDEIKG